MNDFRCTYTDSVVCPECGHVHRNSWEMDDGTNSCGECGVEFELIEHVIIKYSTRIKK